MKVVWLVRTRARGRTWRQYNRRYACVLSSGSITSTTGDPPPLVHKTRAEAESTAQRFQLQYGVYEEAKVVARRVDEAAPLRNARGETEPDAFNYSGNTRLTIEAFRAAARDMMRRSR